MISAGVSLRWLVAMVLGLTAAVAGEARWRAGIGRENITPPAGLWMTGYGVRDQPAEGAAQDLWVKALVLADSFDRRGIIFTLDLCDITREISESVAARLMTRFAAAPSGQHNQKHTPHRSRRAR